MQHDDLYKSYVRSTIKEVVQEDTSLNLTQDISELRYGGPIPVFLFDGMKEQASWLQKFNFAMNEDITFIARSASTRRSFVPFRYTKKSSKEKGHLVVPLSASWPSKIEEGSLPSGIDHEVVPRPLNGVLVAMSLEAICKMDDYMGHGIVTRRIRTDIELPTGHTRPAFMYCSPDSAFMKYDPHEKVYEMSRETKALEKTQRGHWLFNTYIQ